jgi:hypothetical protein
MFEARNFGYETRVFSRHTRVAAPFLSVGTNQDRASSAWMQFVAAPLIDSLLGKFIKLDGRSLDTSGGKVRLSRVELRQDAFDDLGLPFALRGGVIEEVEVDIPWTKLKTDSVVIRLHQPVLLFAPISESEWDHLSEARRRASQKARALQQLREAAAPLKASAAYKPIDSDEKNGFLESLLAKITDNLQVGRRSGGPRSIESLSRAHQSALRARGTPCPRRPS